MTSDSAYSRKKPRPVKGRGQSSRDTTCYDALPSTVSPAVIHFAVSVSLQPAWSILLFSGHTVSGNGGMPSEPTAFHLPERERVHTLPEHGSLAERFGLKLGSDLHSSPTRAGLAPSPARCAFEKSATVFFNVCVCSYL